MFIDLRERERETYIWETSISQVPFQDGTHNLRVCPDQGLNLQPFGAQADSPNNWAPCSRLELDNSLSQEDVLHPDLYLLDTLAPTHHIFCDKKKCLRMHPKCPLDGSIAHGIKPQP